jgi:hypothetical protein
MLLVPGLLELDVHPRVILQFYQDSTLPIQLPSQLATVHFIETFVGAWEHDWARVVASLAPRWVFTRPHEFSDHFQRRLGHNTL